MEPRKPWGKRIATEAGPRIYRVSELNRAANNELRKVGEIWIEGEVMQPTISRLGHCYFTLSDENDSAQVSAVAFQSVLLRSNAPLAAGARIRVRGSLSIYEPRGQFQIQVQVIELAGAGDLAARREAVRVRLDLEGFFSPERKRALPRFPLVIGIVTSVHGAALRDVVRVASDRYPVRLLVSDCQVQGELAPASICAALRRLRTETAVDAVIVCRGGGSAEDLAAFDDEEVCRAIAAHPVPVVCGVGHESDVSLAELVADVRAATPSHAAELLVPTRDGISRALSSLEMRLQSGLQSQLDRSQIRLQRERQRLVARAPNLSAIRLQVAGQTHALSTALRRYVASRRTPLMQHSQALSALHPRMQIATSRRTIELLSARLGSVPAARLHDERKHLQDLTRQLLRLGSALMSPRRQKFAGMLAQLDALSPLAVLERGYAIPLSANLSVLRSVDDMAPGTKFDLKMHDGRVQCEVVGPCSE